MIFRKVGKIVTVSLYFMKMEAKLLLNYLNVFHGCFFFELKKEK